MGYTFQFGQVWPFLPRFFDAALVSLQLALLAFCGGLLLGTAGAAIRTYGGAFASGTVKLYVTAFTNTPQLVQIYFLYFALPDAGLVLSSFTAVLIGMTLNAGAYLTEIQRAGFESARRSELEAAAVLGFSRLQQIRYVVLPHAMRVLLPPLSSHFIIMTLGTSMAAVFGVEELTGEALTLSSQTFRSVEVFLIVAGFYVALTLVASLAIGLFARLAFRVRVRPL
ncbi:MULTISPECIES: amino acid ABC transporter permease [Methylobacterium]|uniref:amino acid ABC transporter permease n=1 Tax=Methylobacterium TaxID=407 RepID=UPI0013EDAB37|nr:amino acid ABC transporter permease [Methylobacterium sp. DB0501]NGM32882.1 amino acid ABC transporter permease [Methylobacterium sp. DB0501]